MRLHLLGGFMMFSLVLTLSNLLVAAEAEPPADATAYPLAVLPFQERGEDVAGVGAKVTDLLYVNLLTQPELFLVDREDLQKTLSEQELNISGAVNADQAVKVGQLTGAKILVTGSVMQVGNATVLVAKVIGTETTRVLGASVKGASDDELTTLVDELGKQVGGLILAKASVLVAQPVTDKDRIAEINKTLGDAKRPSVQVKIEERHVGRATIDPAAETEIAMLCKETGFVLIDAQPKPDSKADVIITGEGFSEYSGRVSNLISVKARLEVKAIDRKSGKVLSTDRQTTVVVDLSEQIAGKTALQQAAAIIAERMLPKLTASAE